MRALTSGDTVGSADVITVEFAWQNLASEQVISDYRHTSPNLVILETQASGRCSSVLKARWDGYVPDQPSKHHVLDMDGVLCNARAHALPLVQQ
jgi:hypothetical protein